MLRTTTAPSLIIVWAITISKLSFCSMAMAGYALVYVAVRSAVFRDVDAYLLRYP